MAERKPIKIKKSKRGVFTAKAKRAGMGVATFARHVLSEKNKGRYSAETRKQASFAKGIAGASRKKGKNPRGKG